MLRHCAAAPSRLAAEVPEATTEIKPGAQLRVSAPNSSQTPQGVTERLDHRWLNGISWKVHRSVGRRGDLPFLRQMAFPRSSLCFTPGFTCAAPSVLPILLVAP
jgi:hypothetical protein